MQHQLPKFLHGVFLWEGLGYTFAGEPPLDLLSPAALGDANPWIVLAAALQRAKRGNFTALPLLVPFFHRYDDQLLHLDCVMILGQAGPGSLLRNVVQEYAKQLYENNDSLIQEYIAFMLRESLLLWGAGTAIDLYLRTIDRKKSIIPNLISELIEKERGPVYKAALPDDEYRQLVQTRCTELATKLGGTDVPVLYGELFSTRAVAERLHASLTNESKDRPYAFRDRAIFEAATGIDCSTFYKNTRLQPLIATAIVEKFLQSEDVNKYQPGVRYFFGHRIPD